VHALLGINEVDRMISIEQNFVSCLSVGKLNATSKMLLQKTPMIEVIVSWLTS
jgi:hypothetical protein